MDLWSKRLLPVSLAVEQASQHFVANDAVRPISVSLFALDFGKAVSVRMKTDPCTMCVE